MESVLAAEKINASNGKSVKEKREYGMGRSLLATRVSSNGTDGGLLMIRLVVGVALIIHGWGKIQAPFSWMGPDAPVPGIFQFLAAFSEVGGGLALVLGLLSRLGALGVAFTMAVAVATHLFVMRDPFVNVTGQGSSYELALVYLTIATFIVLNGPGKFSLDAKIFGIRQ